MVMPNWQPEIISGSRRPHAAPTGAAGGLGRPAELRLPRREQRELGTDEETVAGDQQHGDQQSDRGRSPQILRLGRGGPGDEDDAVDAQAVHALHPQRGTAGQFDAVAAPRDAAERSCTSPATVS